MNQVFINLLFFLIPAALVFFTVYAKGHWWRATAGSLAFVAWLLTAAFPLARLSYHREAAEAFVREIDRRIRIGDEAVPKEASTNAIHRLDRGDDPLEVFTHLARTMKDDLPNQVPATD